MPFVVLAVPIKDIIGDADQPLNLEDISEDEAITRIKGLYGFLSTAIEVDIKDGIAYIKLIEAEAHKIDQALEAYRRGVKEGETGNYRKALRFFKQVVSIIPSHVDARRNLAMSYLELGNIEEAKNHLIETLRLDPKDVWGYLLLGNIYGKNENDHVTQEKFYLKALELNPKDAILLNNIAAMKMESGDDVKAIELFKQALGINPNYPNTYYGLALVYFEKGDLDKSIQTIEDLFTKSNFDDPRSKPVISESRRLFYELNSKIDINNIGLATTHIEEKKALLEEQTGFEIRLIEDNSLEYVAARTQMAWKHQRKHHEIRFRMISPQTVPHIQSHELEHIVLEYEARKTGRN